MTFLTGLAAQLLYLILAAAVGLVVAYIAKIARRSQIDKEAEKSVQPLKDAKTPEEVDRAADSALDHL